MNKYFILILLNFAVISLAMAQTIPVEVTPKSWNFGKIIDTKRVQHTFVITNNSDRTVTLEGLPSSCGCMVARPYPSVLAPGQKAKLDVLYEPRGTRALFRWEARVATDHPLRPIITVPLQAYVLLDSVISSDIANFQVFKRGQQKKVTLWMACKQKKNFKIHNIIGPAGFQIRYHEQKVEGFYPGTQRGYKIEITANKDIHYGRNHGIVTIQTDIPKLEKIRVKLFAYVTGDITASPDYISFGVLKPGMQKKRKIAVSHNEYKDLKIVKLKSNLKFVTAKLQAVVPNKYYYVYVTLNCPEVKKSQEFRGKIQIETNCATQKEITIKLQGFIKLKNKK